MGIERVQNGYRTDIERISNGYGMVTKEKSVLYKRTHSSEHMLVSYAISAHQRFEDDTILNTRSSKFCPAWQS